MLFIVEFSEIYKFVNNLLTLSIIKKCLGNFLLLYNLWGKKLNIILFPTNCLQIAPVLVCTMHLTSHSHGGRCHEEEAPHHFRLHCLADGTISYVVSESGFSLTLPGDKTRELPSSIWLWHQICWGTGGFGISVLCFDDGFFLAEQKKSPKPCLWYSPSLSVNSGAHHFDSCID